MLRRTVKSRENSEIRGAQIREFCKSCDTASSGLQYRHSRHLLRAQDSKGPRGPVIAGARVGWPLWPRKIRTDWRTRTVSASRHFLMSTCLNFWFLEAIILIGARQRILGQDKHTAVSHSEFSEPSRILTHVMPPWALRLWPSCNVSRTATTSSEIVIYHHLTKSLSRHHHRHSSSMRATNYLGNRQGSEGLL